MDLKSEISTELWDVVSGSYKKGVYKAAILDAVHFLSDVLRDKADLDEDGEKLVNQALGTNNPRLKINKYQTQTEIDEHRGFRFLLQGLYVGIRNPRSHKQYEDSEDTANTLILFIDYLLKKSNLATPAFTIDKWLQYIFDPNFVFSDQYIELLIQEIPQNKIFDTTVILYRKTSFEYLHNLQFSLNKLFNNLNQEQMEQFVEIVSEDLREIIDDKKLRNILAVLPKEIWPLIKEISRIRVKNKIFYWIEKAKIHKREIFYEDWESTLEETFNDEAAFVSWIEHLLCLLHSESRLFWLITEKLGSSYGDQNFVCRYFLKELSMIIKHQGDNQYDINMSAEILAKAWIKSSPVAIDESSNTLRVSSTKEAIDENFLRFQENLRHSLVQKIEDVGCPDDYQSDLESLKAKVQDIEF